MLRGVHETTELAISLGVLVAFAIAKGLRAVVAPLPPGKADGLARALHVWRYADGTFMPEPEKFETYREEYERHAKGGRARAGSAVRGLNGRFV
jgi:hypothetical protein